ncbi:TetR-like C-terminal domain-containing protein [Streptomyces sp. RLB1-33]|nr:TetR-like C-terminal domain-containing protein [Streptomyces sp. RLB1-33]QIY76116.1 WHG domain-containing protein [Streptomyces sp. RLB1-33]
MRPRRTRLPRTAQKPPSAAQAAAAGQEIVALAQAYVRYALDHPALFRLMFSRPCAPSHPEVRAAGDAAYAVISHRVDTDVPQELCEARVAGWWPLVHGLASLSPGLVRQYVPVLSPPHPGDDHGLCRA